MKKIKIAILTTLGVTALCGFLISTAFAQDGAKAAKLKAKADEKKAQALAKYDADKNGVLDETEKATMKADAQAAKEAKQKANLEKYDTNKNGILDPVERKQMNTDNLAKAREAKAAKQAESNCTTEEQSAQ